MGGGEGIVMDEDGTIFSKEELRRQQRNFYLYLSPINGHEIAGDQANFLPADDDITEAELRDILAFWLRLQAGKAGTVMANCSWWMLRCLDPDAELDAGEGMERLDDLVSFLVSSVKQLADAGVISILEQPDIPDIRLSTEQEFDQKATDLFKNIEKWLKEPEDDE